MRERGGGVQVAELSKIILNSSFNIIRFVLVEMMMMMMMMMSRVV